MASQCFAFVQQISTPPSVSTVGAALMASTMLLHQRSGCELPVCWAGSEALVVAVQKPSAYTGGL